MDWLITVVHAILMQILTKTTYARVFQIIMGLQMTVYNVRQLAKSVVVPAKTTVSSAIRMQNCLVGTVLLLVFVWRNTMVNLTIVHM